MCLPLSATVATFIQKRQEGEGSDKECISEEVKVTRRYVCWETVGKRGGLMKDISVTIA